MSKQFKVGLIALTAGAVLYWGFNYLKGTDFFSPTNRYYVIYDNVDGLNKSNPVIINGLNVGRVTRIQIMQKEDNQMLVEFDIQEDIIIGKDAKASLSNTDIFGSKGIILEIGDRTNPMIPGDTLEPVVDKGLNELIEKASPTVSGINTTIARINGILLDMEGSGEEIKKTIEALRIMSEKVNDEIDNNKRNVQKVTTQLTELIPNINAKVNQMGELVANSNAVMDSVRNIQINKTLEGINEAVYNLNETILYIKESEGTVGKLIKNDSVYNNLNKLLMDIDKFIIHFDQYPKDFMKPLGRKHDKLQGN